MGDLPRNNRLGPRQILAIALTERELQNIRLVIREKKFTQNVILTTKTSLVLLGMALVTEVAALRTLTLLLLIVLIGLSFLPGLGGTAALLSGHCTFESRN